VAGLALRAAAAKPSAAVSDSLPLSGAEYRVGMPDPTGAARVRRYRNRKERVERLASIRVTQGEIEKLATRGYAVEPGVSLAAVVEMFVSDSLGATEGPVIAYSRPSRVT
jgi:hypothetical protein